MKFEQDNHYLDILHALSGYLRSQHAQPDLDDYFAEFLWFNAGGKTIALML